MLIFHIFTQRITRNLPQMTVRRHRTFA